MEEFKVVLVSNFDNPMVADKLLTEDLFTSKEEARTRADEFNEAQHPNSTYYARVKPADYNLYSFQP